MISAIVMASGYSKRMGQEKLLLEYGGKSIIERLLDVLLESKDLEILLIARNQKIIEIGKSKSIKVIENQKAFNGISESIKLGVLNAATNTGYMFVAGDQPFLDIELINQLISKFKNHPKSIIIPEFKGRRGNPVIFPYEMKNEFLKLSGDIGGKQIINKHLDQIEFVAIKDDKKLFDVDTKENYEYIIKMKEDEPNESKANKSGHSNS